MNYAKIAASKSKDKGKSQQNNQTQSKPKKEKSSYEKLISFPRKDHIPKKPPEEKTLKPVQHDLMHIKRPKTDTELSVKLSHLTIEEETVEQKKERIKQRLQNFQSPFVWKAVDVKPLADPKISLPLLQEKDEEIKDEREFKWRNFILRLVISYQLYRMAEVSKSLQEVKDLESTLVDLGRMNCKEQLFQNTKSALWHVVTASKAMLYLEMGFIKDSEKLLDEIQAINTMDHSNQAAIHGIRAAVFMEFGHKGNKNAEIEASKALELDPECAEWHFLLGKSMGRVRRVEQCYERVDPKEVPAMNRAVKLDETNPLYKVHLAQVLSERAFREYKASYPEHKTEQCKRLKKIQGAAKYMFIDAKNKRPDCPHILMRCAYGMMKLPADLVDLAFVRKCLDKANELAPNNSRVHHYKGMFHERFHVEVDIPLAEYKLAANLGNFGAAMDYVQMLHRLKKSDIIEELKKVASNFEEQVKLEVVYAQAGSYLLFIKKDLVNSLKFYNTVMEMDPDSYAMKKHKVMFIRMKDPVNMFGVLLEELENRTEWGSFNQEEKRFMSVILFKLSEAHGKLPKESRLSVEQILEMSIKQEEKDRKFILKHNLRNKKKQQKKWRSGPRDSDKKKNNKDSTENVNDSAKENSNRGRGRERQKKKDRRSSASSVDSDYHRDMTISKSWGSDKSLNSTKDHSTFVCKQPVLGKRASQGYNRDSSVDSTSSLKQRDFFSDAPNSNYFGHRQQSITSSCSLESISQGSKDTRSVMERVKDSYAMLSYKNKDSTNKKNFHKSRSSQSLNAMETDADHQQKLRNKKERHNSSSMESLTNSMKNLSCDQQKSRHIKERHNSSSMESLTNSMKNLTWDQKKSRNKNEFHNSSSVESLTDSIKNWNFQGYKPKFGSRDSSVESNRSLTFMPNFARNHSESDLNK